MYITTFLLFISNWTVSAQESRPNLFDSDSNNPGVLVFEVSRGSLMVQVYTLTKLQQVMGHSNMTVSLGYLRNLELPTLTMEDMPVISQW